MADLSVEFMGLKLPNPLIAGSSPLADSTDGARRLEDAGAAAIVLRSLFEEQLTGVEGAEGAAFSPEEYMAHLVRVKETVHIPVFGSLNGSSRGGWLEQARRIEQAGADALELNLYLMSTDAWDPPQVIERRTEEVVRAVKSLVRIPVAVKLSAFYTSIPNLVQRLDAAGADAFVLFNRYCLPDFDLETGAPVPAMPLSDPTELPLRLHATALLSGRIRAAIAVSGGVASSTDALKAVAAGAHAVQMVSALIRQGPECLRRVREGMSAWLDVHGHASLAEFRGRLNLAHCPDPHAWQRGQYRRALRGGVA
jgi:dihydroorotate dehydrogenase (fumarate)